MTIIANFLMIVEYFPILVARTSTTLPPVIAIFGFTSGTFVSLQAPMITRLAVDMRRGGTMVGQVMGESRRASN